MCQFNHLSPGEHCTLTTSGNPRCLQCSSDMHNYDGPVVYNGHVDNGMIMHSFTIMGAWKCNVCMSNIVEFITPCDDYGALITLPMYRLDVVSVE